MKKLILLPALALCFVNMLTSCDSKSGKRTLFEVTVIAKDTSFLATASTTVVGDLPKVIVVTKSGDTLEASIAEDVLLNKKIPFTATMKKTRIERFGMIVSTN